MAKALKIAALVASVAAIAVVTGGAGLGLGLSLTTTAFGVSAGTLLAASAVLGTGASLLAPKPKAPGGLTSTSDRLTVSINTREPRKIVFGSTAMATDLRDQEYSSDQTFVHRFIVLASHKIHAVRAIYFDDKLAWTAAGGAQGEFRQWLQVTPVLEGSAANAINLGPRMGASRRYTGCAYLYLRYQILANSKKLDSVFNQSIPSRVTIVGDGASVYDPRRDSTVPGGSGPQRADDQSTWAWDDSASRNPALATLFYLLGWRINGRLAVGKGIPPKRLDLASFIEAANLCDEPVARSAGGTEPRYRCDGVISEGDSTEAVLDNLKATMNGVIDDVDGRLRVTVLHNDLAAPIGDLFSGDVLGNFTWQQTLPLNDSVSVIRGGYVDPSTSSLYQLVDYPEISIASRDGIERSQTINYPLVQSASQAQRLSKQRLQRMIYGGTFTAVFQSTAWKFQKGDVIRFSFRPLGWDRKLFRIADIATQVDGKVPMMLREEHPAIYAWDASDAAPVMAAEPTKYDPALWPLVQGVTEAGTTAEWDKVADPNNTKPQDNATVGAPSGTNIGDQPVDDVLAEIAAAKKRREEIDADLLVIDGAVKDAGDRITAAQARADEAFTNADTVNSRVDQLIAEGGGGSEGVDTVARAEISRVEQAAIKGDAAIAKSVADLSASTVVGANKLSNTDFALDAAGWQFNSEAGSIGGRDANAGAEWRPVGTHVLNIYQPNGSQDRGGWFLQRAYGLEPGKTYQATCWIAAHRCLGGLYLDICDDNGAYLATPRVEMDGGDHPGGPIESYQRVVVTFVAPARASQVLFYLMKYGTFAGEANSHVWFLRPQLVEVRPDTTALVPYSPGSGDVGLIAVDAQIHRVEQAFTDATSALARRTDELEASIDGDLTDISARVATTESALADLPNNYATAQRVATLEARTGQRPNIQANGGFENGGAGLVIPKGGAVIDDAASGKRVLHWALEGTSVAFLPPINVQPGGRYTVSYELTFSADAGTVRVDPSQFAGIDGTGAVTYDTVTGPSIPVGSSTSDRRKEFSFTAAASARSIQLRLIAEGVTKPRSIDFARIKVEAGDAPSTAYTADATLNGVSATIDDRATVIADKAAAAVAQTVSTLRSEYDQARAELTSTSATAADAYGRSRAYIRQGAVAGNNRAQLTLWADSNSGAGVDIVGDVAIAGNLLVDGSIISSKFNDSSMSRFGTAGWTGSVSGVPGGANVPFSLTLNPIYPRGRFMVEAVIAVQSDVGQTTVTDNYNGTGKQLRVTRVADGGGLFLRSYDDQGNVYRINPGLYFQSLPVLATTLFGTTFVATVYKSNYDTGVINEGDYYSREIAASYTVTTIQLRVTWVAV